MLEKFKSKIPAISNSRDSILQMMINNKARSLNSIFPSLHFRYLLPLLENPLRLPFLTHLKNPTVPFQGDEGS
jgi:hypothetical protein